MKLEKKKELAARALNVGKNRVIFNSSRLSEVKEAITKQDIILVNEKKGRRKVINKKTRRRSGSVKKKVRKTKRTYIILTRKLRTYLSSLRNKKLISEENFKNLRKEIRASNFRSLSHMKERISSIGGTKWKL